MEMVTTARPANWFLAFYRSALGKKTVMALTGIVLFGFVFMHMAGNLKVFMGAEAFNHYAEFLRAEAGPRRRARGGRRCLDRPARVQQGPL